MKHKILIVEDDADLRRALGARLHSHGYETVAAGDGATAIATARSERPSHVPLSGECGARLPRVLIVEDDADTRLGLEVRLRASGFEVVTAADAVTALTLARREKPDLITLDLGLPGGDGLQVLDRIRNQPGLDGVPVIVLSARDGTIHGPKALGAGASAYLEKPVDNAKLVAAIRSALGIRAA